MPRLRPHDEHDVPGAGRAHPGLHPRPDAGVEDDARRRRNDDARRDGLRRQRSGRIEGGEHRHQPARHRRGAELSRSSSTASTSRRCAAPTTSSRRSSSDLVDDYVEHTLRPTLIASCADALHRVWGFSEFRPLQREAMHAILDARDSVVVLPTGGGKSLCFQAPAIVDTSRGRPAAARGPRLAASRSSSRRSSR